MHILLRRVLPIGVALFLSSAAEAAVIGGIEGEVYVNRGAGYQRVESVAELNAGDSVMAGAAGRATINYGDGCTIELVPGAVVAIGPASPCSIETGSNPPPAGGGFGVTELGVGALVVGGVAGAIVLLGDDDNGSGSSGSGSGGPSSGGPSSDE